MSNSTCQVRHVKFAVRLTRCPSATRSSACSPSTRPPATSSRSASTASLRHAWHASHSQIYPELARLQEAGHGRGRRRGRAPQPHLRGHRRRPRGAAPLDARDRAEPRPAQRDRGALVPASACSTRTTAAPCSSASSRTPSDYARDARRRPPSSSTRSTTSTRSARRSTSACAPPRSCSEWLRSSSTRRQGRHRATVPRDQPDPYADASTTPLWDFAVGMSCSSWSSAADSPPCTRSATSRPASPSSPGRSSGPSPCCSSSTRRSATGGSARGGAPDASGADRHGPLEAHGLLELAVRTDVHSHFEPVERLRTRAP